MMVPEEANRLPSKARRSAAHAGQPAGDNGWQHDAGGVHAVLRQLRVLHEAAIQFDSMGIEKEFRRIEPQAGRRIRFPIGPVTIVGAASRETGRHVTTSGRARPVWRVMPASVSAAAIRSASIAGVSRSMAPSGG